jgi:CRP-like cAMP-binding protein
MADLNSNYIKLLEKLFRDGRVKVYSKNQLINYEDDPLTYVYYIKKGFIKAYTILESGDTRTIMLLSPGDIFPLAFSQTMDWENYKVKYFYQTLVDTELLTLQSDVLKRHIDSDPEMMKTYMNYLAASNEAIMMQLAVMKNKKAIDKVGLLLPYLASKAGKEVKPGVYQMAIKFSHQEIADLSGVTRETTTTLIKQLEKEGVVNQRRGLWLIDLNNIDKVPKRAK